MNPLDNIKEQSIERPIDNIEQQNDSFEIPKKDILSNYEEYDTFERLLNVSGVVEDEENISEEIKNKLLSILEKISEADLIDFIELENDETNFIEKESIENFIDTYKDLIEEDKEEDNNKKSIENIFSVNFTEEDKKDKIELSKEKATLDKEKATLDKEKATLDKEKATLDKEKATLDKEKALNIFVNNKEKYKKIFGEDSEFFQLFNDYEGKELVSRLTDFVSDKNKAQDFFNKIALSGDKELYEQTYNSFVNISGGQNSDVAKDFEKWGISKTLPVLDPHFGVAKSQVERNGTVLSYRNMTFDMKTGESYMHSEKGYKIEIDIQKTDILETKIKYQKQRLDVLEELKDLKDFEHTANGVLKDLNENKIFDRKKELLGYVDELKASKTSSEKNGTDLGIDMEINRALKEIDLINKKIESIKEIFPFKGYASEADYKDGLTRFLETKLIMTKQKVSELETELKDISKKMQDEISQKIIKQHNDIEKQAESKREISDFIHSIGFDLLPQSLTNQIITELKSNRLNIAGMDIDRANIDLSNGNFGEKGVGEKDSNMWKTNLVKFMEKMIYGEIGAKGSIFSGKNFKGMFGAFINPLELNNELEKNNIKTSNGFDIEQIRTNLKKQNTDTQNTKKTQNDR